MDINISLSLYIYLKQLNSHLNFCLKQIIIIIIIVVVVVVVVFVVVLVVVVLVVVVVSLAQSMADI